MTLDFPRSDHFTQADWAPIYYQPIRGSGERLVVGVLAVSEEAAHLEFVNAFERLECLYGQDFNAIKYALELARTHFQSELDRNFQRVLSSDTPLTGVSIGDVRRGEGRTIADIAINWLSQTSSLYKKDFLAVMTDRYVEAPVAHASHREPSSHRDLGHLVYELVTRERQGLETCFAKGLRGTPKKKSHDVRIDFAGSRMVANFGLLKPKFTGHSSNAIKRKLWDLAIERDQEKRTFSRRVHELLVQVPTKDDPELDESGRDRVNEALEALEKQADIEELRLRPMPSAEVMANHVLSLEATA